MKKGYAAVSGRVAKSVLVGATTSIVTVAVLVSLITSLVLSEKMPLASIKFVVPPMHFVALLVGCMLAGHIKREKVLYSNCVVLLVIYFICICAVILLDTNSVIWEFKQGLNFLSD